MSICRVGRHAATLLLGAALVGDPTSVFAFGHKGHEIVGYTAWEYLQAPESGSAGRRTVQKLRQLLPAGFEDLGTACTWADRIKGGAMVRRPLGSTSDAQAVEDPDAGDFLRREVNGNRINAAHDDWHFVNLPYQIARYEEDAIGAQRTDVVQMMQTCINVLRGQSNRFTERQALYLLAHYIGDIHQPLHVGCGYIQTSMGENGRPRFQFAVPASPNTGAGALPHDEGGNRLRWGQDYDRNLHSYWDTDLVEHASGSRSAREYAADLVRNVAPVTGWKANGQVQGWPAQWASDALPHAREAYRGLRLLRSATYRTRSGRVRQGWAITRPDGYAERGRDITRVQLAKGGYRLAQVLMNIWGE